jgi:hypothetical protein
MDDTLVNTLLYKFSTTMIREQPKPEEYDFYSRLHMLEERVAQLEANNLSYYPVLKHIGFIVPAKDIECNYLLVHRYRNPECKFDIFDIL